MNGCRTALNNRQLYDDYKLSNVHPSGALLLGSCSRQADSVEDTMIQTPDTIPFVEEFVIQEITFLDDTTASFSPATDKVFIATFENRSDVVVTRPFLIDEDLIETSAFFPSDSILLKRGSSIQLLTPIVNAGRILFSSRSREYTYGQAQVFKKPLWISSNVNVSPRSAVELKVVVSNYKVDVPYEALCEAQTGRRVTVRGRWQGTNFDEVSATFTEIALTIRRKEQYDH